MEECGDALGRWLRLLRRQLVTGIFHPRSRVPAWGRPGDAARAFPEELVGKIRSDASSGLGDGVFGALLIAIGVRPGLGSPWSWLGVPYLAGDNLWLWVLGLPSPS